MDNLNFNRDEIYAPFALTGSQSIRVFDLQPLDPNSPENTIRGTLRVVDLSHGPKFVAVSYIWGVSSSPSLTILCGLQSINVTNNLWHALDSLRRDPQGEDPGRNTDGSISLWIDTLCINQRDSYEVVKQIQLMGDIYACSTSMCIWLGKSTSKSEKAVEFAKHVGWQNKFEKEGDNFYHMPGWKVIWKAAFQQAWLQFSNALVWKGPVTDLRGNIQLAEINEFLDNVWIRRIWTLQEVAVAPNPWICYGSHRLSWRSMLYAIAYLSWAPRNMTAYEFSDIGFHSWQRIINLWLSITTPSRPGLVYSPMDSPPGCSQIEHTMADYISLLVKINIWTSFVSVAAIVSWFILYWVALICIIILVPGIPSRGTHIAQAILGAWFVINIFLVVFGCVLILRKSNITSQQTALSAVVQETWLRDATKPEDKVYGVHGVMAKIGVQLQPPDLSMDLGDLYRLFFIEVVQATKNLNLLLGATGAFPNQPSWVPNWRLKSTDHWIHPSIYLEERLTYSTYVQPQIIPTWGQCTPSSHARFTFPTQREIAVEGWRIGTVSWKGAAFAPVESATPTTGDNRDQHIQNVQVLTEAMRRKKDQSSSRNDFRAYIFNLPKEVTAMSHRERLNREKQAHPGSWPVDWEQPTTGVLNNLRQNAATWDSFVNMCGPLAAKERTLFWSDSPTVNCIGNIGIDARVGDEIVLLSGVHFPVVLRETEGICNYRLVGYAVLDSIDIMEGKMWLELSSRPSHGNLKKYSIS